MEEMYDDTNEVHGLLTTVSDEDSVDIYSGMDTGLCSVAEEPLLLPSPRLKESMDLYEEILTEEQKSKESSFNELKTRFIAAQSQIEELHRRLKQMETKNTGLTTENYRLKKNISALLRTARQEVLRKDEEIQKLNQRSGRAHYQPRINGLRDPVSDRHTSSCSSTSKPPPPPTNPPLPPAPPPLPPPPPPPSSPPAQPRLPSPPKEDCLQTSSPQLPKKESNSANHQPSASCLETTASSPPSETTAKQTEPCVSSVSKSSSDPSSGCSELDKRKQSKHREEKCESRRSSESTDRRHKSSSDSTRECHIPERNGSHRAEKEAGKKYDKSCKSRNYQDVERHDRSERPKSPQPDSSHSAASSSYGSKGLSEDAKGRSRERRQDKSKITASDSAHSTASTHGSKETSKDSSETWLKGYSREHRKTKIGDGYSRNGSDSKERRHPSSAQHSQRSSESSRWKGGGSPSRDHRRKDKRRQKDSVRQGDKRSREGEKKRSKEREDKEVSRKDGERKTNGDSNRFSEEPNADGKSSVEENSPNRKLCFMETLNLTLSPVKKPMLPIDARQQDVTPADEGSESGAKDDEEQPNIDDLCVIDEIENSSLEMEIDDAEDNKDEKRSSDIPESSNSEMIDLKCDDVEVSLEKDKIQTRTDVVSEQPEDNTVQTTSACSQLPEAAEDQTTGHLTPKSPKASFVTGLDNDNISKTTMENIECASDNKTVEPGDPEVTACLAEEPGSISETDICNSSKKKKSENQTRESQTGETEPSMIESIAETPRTTSHSSLPVEAVREDPADSRPRENPVAVIETAKPGHEHTSPCIPPKGCQQGMSPSTSSNSIHEKEVRNTQDGPADAVSSTISLEAFPQEGLSLPEAIYVLTQTDEDGDSIETEPSSSTGCIAVSKVSSTTEEKATPEKHRGVLAFTPRKTCSPAKGHMEKEGNIEPSSSMPLFHDEDSMMRMLKNLTSIPAAISPVRSPVRPTRRSQLLCQGKPPHIKSLRKDFSSTAAVSNSMKLDVNKENKYPGTPVGHESPNNVDTASDLPSSLSDNELEEGEILSESEEGTAVSPISSPKRAKLTRPVKNQPSHKSASRSSKKLSEERCITSKEKSETMTASAESPSSNKSRFKTVCPTASEASFSNVEDVMETIKTVRVQIRKKYMKLHKIFPKKSFYGMMDNFQESFLEFVDNASFCKICKDVGDLKARMRKMITSVFSKVSNNGIVNRIFEQQAVNLKQKLWDFVEVQLDFLFKEMYSTLTSFCKPTTEKHPVRTEAKDKKPDRNEKLPKQPPVRLSPKLQRQQKDRQSVQTSLKRIRTHPIAPCKTGLGSRGKDIRITCMEKDGNPELLGERPPVRPITQAVVEILPPNNIPSTPEKSNKASLVLSQSGFFQDRTDFEILTEQQASSLTFNLVRDSQMGEIFKCLLQGSDLLDASVTAGDSTSWSISTPRKEALPGESLISITSPTKFISPAKFISPTKFDSPSKLIATWSSISPRKMSSPQSKLHVPLNPAFFDESCLLEVPSETRPMQSVSQRSYSILAEDLAVSLTIPSPLKSDSHLSFLQPPTMEIMSTPESVISAHYSEDALLDGEDATEQDIHLSLDTDNSSCGSSNSATLETAAPSLFHFKPHLPMQAVVMERSNDHFIVKIRQAAADTDVTLTADESLSQTLTEEDRHHGEKDVSTPEKPSKAASPDKSSQSVTCPPKTPPSSENSLHDLAGSSETTQSSQELPPHLSDSSGDEMETSTMSERSLTIAEEASATPGKDVRNCRMGRKRRKHQEKSNAKRTKKDKKDEKKRVSNGPKDGETRRHSKKEKSKADSPQAPLSPNSLSAKNVIKKKGKVVIAWTKDEDRAILLDLRTKGASRETFSVLSEKLNKSSTQIADRFGQLLKLFKKREKMEN